MNLKSSQADFKEDFSQYIAIATDIIHGKKTSGAILKMLAGPDPVQKVSDTAVIIMQRVDGVCRAKSVEVEDTVKAVAASEVVNMLVEIGKAANVLDMPQELVELAYSVSVQDYIKSEIKAGRINRQKMMVAMQADMRKMPPKQRKDIQQTIARIQQTARKYNGGQQVPTPPPGLLASGGAA